MKQKFDHVEMLRGFAAFYVFAGHFVLSRMMSKERALGYPLRFGQEAVMLFFLLSGFVIYYSAATQRDFAFWPYLVRRAKRIYPIFLIALVVSLVTSPEFRHGFSAHEPLGRLLGNIFMMQDFSEGKPGVWVAPYCGNIALWSLSYEWWFYMMFFPLYKYVGVRFRIHCVAALSLLGYIAYAIKPNQPSLFLYYFIIWWCGAELACSLHRGDRITFRSQAKSLIYLAAFATLTALPVIHALIRNNPIGFGIHPFLELRHFCAALILLVVGLVWIKYRGVGFCIIFRPFIWIAPISYALYVFHLPLAVNASYLDAFGSHAFQLSGYVLITFLFAYCAEVPLQVWINRLGSGLAKRLTRSNKS